MVQSQYRSPVKVTQRSEETWRLYYSVQPHQYKCFIQKTAEVTAGMRPGTRKATSI